MIPISSVGGSQRRAHWSLTESLICPLRQVVTLCCTPATCLPRTYQLLLELARRQEVMPNGTIECMPKADNTHFDTCSLLCKQGSALGLTLVTNISSIQPCT